MWNLTSVFLIMIGSGCSNVTANVSGIPPFGRFGVWSMWNMTVLTSSDVETGEVISRPMLNFAVGAPDPMTVIPLVMLNRPTWIGSPGPTLVKVAFWKAILD